jgi:hypothetical protein
MNDDTLISRLAPITDEQAAALVSQYALGELAEEIVRTAPQPHPAAGRPHRRPASRTRRRVTWAAASALAAGAAAAVALAVAAGQPAPGGQVAQGKTPQQTVTQGATPGSGHRATPGATATLAAWTVTENKDGTLKVTIREMKNAAGLQATLRADGARVVVTDSLAWPAACTEFRDGGYRMGQVVTTPNQTGLPTADGTEFLIKPSDIPEGALLWIGMAQTGRPKGVVGPPGPTSFGFLTPSKACLDS